jgi:cellulose synthase/poly-beta-1,6-N-acetylglucosamine synthase-like glycosyltransferase
VKSARGDFVAFIDDDAFADMDWLRNLLRNYKDPEVVGVGGLVKPLWEGNRPIWFPEELNWIFGCSYKGMPKEKTLVRNIIGCNMSFKKEIFDKVGLFRSDVGRFGKMLLGSEETEFCIRIFEKNSNLKIVYDPAAVVYHRINSDKTNLRYLLKRSFGEGLSKALIVNSNRNLNQVLDTERQYLKYLIGTAIPSRLKAFYKPKNICQLTLILLSSCIVAGGFIIGNVLR